MVEASEEVMFDPAAMHVQWGSQMEFQVNLDHHLVSNHTILLQDYMKVGEQNSIFVQMIYMKIKC